MNQFENEYYALGFKRIAGCDEAGRGPIAGPLVVAAVIFEKGYQNELINDSKKLTERKREYLFDIIKEDAFAFKVIIKDEAFIDQHNIYQATKLAMKELYLSLNCDFILTDAMPLDNEAHLSIIKGDQKSVSIAAASILAKVTRDRLMVEYDRLFPSYGFKQHKGYPTKKHILALQEHGYCSIHRLSFEPVKSMVK